jgi:small conductance mechanosensitive channel
MIRFFAYLALVVGLAGLWTEHVSAQTADATPPAAQQKPPQPAVDSAQVKDLIHTLNDPVQRDKLTKQLELLLQQQAAEKPAEEEPLGSRAVKFLSGQVHEIGEEFGALAQAFRGLPAGAVWIEGQIAEPATRARWVALVSSLTMVLAGGAVAFALTYLLVRKPRHAIERRKTLSMPRRLALGLVRLALWMVPIVLFGLVCYALLSTIAVPPLVSMATLAIIDATGIVLVVFALSRFLLAPRRPNLRFVAISDGAALFLHRWICWIAAILSYGGFGVTAARMLGLPAFAAHAAFKVVGLVVLIILMSLVIGKRQPVARWIRGDEKNPEVTGHAMRFGATRRWLADFWHLLAGLYLIVVFATWAFADEGGFEFVLRATLITILAIAGARIATFVVERLAVRGTGTAGEQGTHIQERVLRYLPIIRGISLLVVWIIAIAAIVDVWGMNPLAWFETPPGQVFVSKTITIIFVVVSGLIAWEFVSAIIERYLLATNGNGNLVERSQRARTLLPLLRNAFTIFLLVVTVLIVLSELGINIAPLLAGAGVVGLAIGFGAQTLVKDVITGAFILFENTVAVGDVVDVGAGHSGLVEHFSIRTLKLRDGAGGVHTVPFSAVTSVINMTKDFAYYVFNIKVGYSEDTDRVVGVVSELGRELQSNMSFCDLILAPIEIIGVDSFGGDSVVLQARFKTKPGKQWSVGREFNKRLKKRFDEVGIPLSFPQSMVLIPDARAKVDVPAATPEKADVPAAETTAETTAETAAETQAAAAR